MKQATLFVLIFVFSGFTQAYAAFDHNHGVWEILLKKHVVMKDQNKRSQVDYKGFKSDTGMFVTYLSNLSLVRETEYNTWTRDQKLAFLINAYNAYTIKLILDHYPVKSIKDIGGWFGSPWKMEFIPLLGKKRSLDEIEHALIRQKGVFDEPRIHVALVCAAIGCPALQNRAYTGENISSLLETALVNFLSDTSRNRFNPKKNRFEISPIFQWYGDDFKDKYGSLNQFLIINAKTFTTDPGDIETINKHNFSVDFLDYNWSLNDY